MIAAVLMKHSVGGTETIHAVKWWLFETCIAA